ncbi:MAG TPA: MBL fold metallo-hydrolase [Vicinamibacterales bacterium]|jgi:glyoxylase-like metal-dependent hydrolase (beta-lactamase superfamily II)|nr:MBL fold metallo-hydrolase [Vicinamibacterales bacterium]
MRRSILLAAILIPALTPPEYSVVPKQVQVADGVVLFITPRYGDVGLDGNSVAIISRDGVLVFDSNGTPAAAAAVLAQIRMLTDRPVKYLVNSHWHWDHWYGAEVYKKAFQEIEIITHEKTREMMMGPALAFNKPGLETELPAYVKSLEKKLAAAEAASPPPDSLPRLRQLVEADRFFLDQKTNVSHTFPTRTFKDRLDIDLGGRQVQVLHHERAVTPGDAFLYLPNEKILITGDLLVNPIAFALSVYPSGWLRTLERLDALDASVIVPGHGEPLRDETLLHATMTVFRELLRQGKEAKANGMDVEAARAAIMPSLEGPMKSITGGDPALAETFAIYLVDWYLHRVYDELDGPLTDDIARIPRHKPAGD